MIVCVCNAIDENELRSAARGGAPCPRSAMAHLGCEPQCGTCLCYVQEIIDTERKPRLRVVGHAA